MQTLHNETLKVMYTERQLSVYRQGASVPLLQQNARADERPYIHPIVAPDGNGVLTENQPSHHPWQHGLYVGLNRVNGYGFWEEGLGGNPLDGTFHPQALDGVRLDGNQVRWTVRTVWKEPGGADLLLEEQAWALHDRQTAYELDLTWTLTALQDVVFGQYPYGGLFLRMPYRDEAGTSFANSEGHDRKEAEGRRARWTAIAMPIEGRTGPAGMAILDHPSNEQHPSPWRVDSQLGICPSRCIAGAWSLDRDASACSQYRVYVYCGETNPADIEAAWKRFEGGYA